MENFTHGIMVVNPSLANDEGIPVVHFVGYWEAPTAEDLVSLIDEVRTDETFGLVEMADQLEFYPATKEIIDYYNDLMQKNEN